MSSLLGKYKIQVDTSVLADGDSIASYLVDSAGNLLTSTLVGSDQALDVNVVQSALPTGAATETTLAAVLSELQALSHAEDSTHSSGDLGVMSLAVRNDAGTPLAADGDYIPLSTDANGNLRVAATLDEAGDYPEDSAHTTGDIGYFNLAVRRDTRAVGSSADGDYSSFNVNSVGELWVKDADVLSQLVTIDAVIDNIYTEQLDQGTTLDAILADTANIDSVLSALSKAEDAAHSSGDTGIQALAVRKDSAGSNAGSDGDYSSLQTWSNGELKVVDIANSSVLQQEVTVTTTAAALPASALAGRKSVMIQNVGTRSIFVGASTVTAAGSTGGIEIPKGGFVELEAGPAVSIFGITSASTAAVRVLELA